MERHLWQVTSPDFCAGIITQGAEVIEAAPILRWTVGKDTAYLRSYFDKKGWTVAHVSKEKQS